MFPSRQARLLPTKLPIDTTQILTQYFLQILQQYFSPILHQYFSANTPMDFTAGREGGQKPDLVCTLDKYSLYFSGIELVILCGQKCPVPLEIGRAQKKGLWPVMTCHRGLIIERGRRQFFKSPCPHLKKGRIFGC